MESQISIEKNLTQKNLRYSILDGCSYSFMVGLGETYIAAFVLTKGFSQLSASLISTIPLFAGAILQLASPYGVFRLKSYRKWVTKTSFLQGISLFALAMTTFIPVPVEVLFIIAAFYWAGGMSTGPAWNSWMTKIVPEHSRLKFFSSRSMLSSSCVFIGLVTGGLILHVFSDQNTILKAFFGIFVVSGVLRIISSYLLSLHTENEDMTASIEKFSFRHVCKTIWKRDYARTLKFIFIFQFGVYFSAAFFNPFMLKELQFSYRTYMIMLASSFVAKIIAQPITKKIIESVGPQRTLFFATLGIIPLPLVWTVSQDPVYLAIMQATSGFMWGMYELITFLILFNQIPQKERTEALTFFNFAQTLCIIVGSVIAGFVFKYFGANYQAYMIVFCASTGLRFLALFQFPDLSQNVTLIRNWIMLKPSGLRLSRVDFFSQPLFIRGKNNKNKPQPKKSGDSKKVS
ncbi:MAG: MFS transporter [Bdellovibrionota bacterium]